MGDVTKATSRCSVCARPSTTHCAKCKTPYCGVACQADDWKKRGHKKACKRLATARAFAAALSGDAASRDEAPTPPPPKQKAAPPVADAPARGRADVERAKAAAAAAATTAATPSASAPDDGREDAECPICFDTWDVNEPRCYQMCCFKTVCARCNEKLGLDCPLCRTPRPTGDAAALARCRRHAEDDNPAAMSFLGQCYAKGLYGLEPSHKKAARLLQRAADLGDVMATVNLGNLYGGGKGVAIDAKKMVACYRAAANRGNATAQFNLGACFYDGAGVAKNFVETARLFRLAADQGHTEAEYNLGCMYAHGRGVVRDTVEAVRWARRAAAKGHEGARDTLDRVY